MNQGYWSDRKAQNKEDWFKLEKLFNDVAQQRQLAVFSAITAPQKLLKPLLPSTSICSTSTNNRDGSVNTKVSSSLLQTSTQTSPLYKVQLNNNLSPKLSASKSDENTSPTPTNKRKRRRKRNLSAKSATTYEDTADIDFSNHALVNETKELHEHLLSDKNVVSIESTHTEVLEEGRGPPQPIKYTKRLSDVALSIGNPPVFTPILPDVQHINFINGISVLPLSQNPLNGCSVSNNYKPKKLCAPKFVLPDLKKSFNRINILPTLQSHPFPIYNSCSRAERSIGLNPPNDVSMYSSNALSKNTKPKKRNVTRPRKRGTSNTLTKSLMIKQKENETKANIVEKWSLNSSGYHIYNGRELIVKFEIKTGCIYCKRKPCNDKNEGDTSLNSDLSLEPKTRHLLSKAANHLYVKNLRKGDSNMKHLKYHQYSIKSTKFGSSIQSCGIVDVGAHNAEVIARKKEEEQLMKNIGEFLHEGECIGKSTADILRSAIAYIQITENMVRMLLEIPMAKHDTPDSLSLPSLISSSLSEDDSSFTTSQNTTQSSGFQDSLLSLLDISDVNTLEDAETTAIQTSNDISADSSGISTDQINCHMTPEAFLEKTVNGRNTDSCCTNKAVLTDFPSIDNDDTVNSLNVDDSSLEIFNSTALLDGEYTSLYDNHLSSSSFLVSPTKIFAINDDSKMITSDVNLNSVVSTKLFASPSKCFLDFMNTSFDEAAGYMNSSQYEDQEEQGLVPGPLTFSPIKFNALNK